MLGIPVSCTVEGAEVNGILVDISTQTLDDSFGKIIPVGIILLDGNNDPNIDGAFRSVPMEFITRKNTL